MMPTSIHSALAPNRWGWAQVCCYVLVLADVEIDADECASSVTWASWAGTRAATATRRKRTMRPWARRREKPAWSTSQTPPLTPTATASFLSAPPSLMTPCLADRSRTWPSITPARATPPTSSPAACPPGTASPRRSPATQTAPGSTRASPAAGRGIPAAFRPLWAKKRSPAASPGASPRPCPADTAPAWAAWSSRCRCAPTPPRPTCATTRCLRTRARRWEPPAARSAPQTPSLGGRWSTNPSGLSTTRRTAPAVSLSLLINPDPDTWYVWVMNECFPSSRSRWLQTSCSWIHTHVSVWAHLSLSPPVACL